MNGRAVILALFTAAALAIGVPRPAAAAPALWVVQSSAGKLYLFGTVHLLREGTQWRSPELEAAMKESQDLYLEIADPMNRASVMASLLKVGYDRDHPLSTKISKADVVLLDKTAKQYGLGGEAALEPMRPGKVDAMVDAWLTGNQDDVAKSLQIGKFEQSPIYAKMFTDRNRAWAAELAQRLKQPGTSFVSVGAQATPTPATPTTPAPGASTTPSPQVSETPIPVTLAPPPGWKARSVSLSSGPFKADRMWVDSYGKAVIMSGHLDLTNLGITDLETLDTLLHQGLVAAAGAKGTQPSQRVKICNGKQDGTYTKVTLSTVKEDIVLAVSDRGYLAEYVRPKSAADDPAATRSLLTLCAP